MRSKAKPWSLAIVWICLVSLCVSLVAPYSSECFYKEFRVKTAPSNAEKVQISTTLAQSPAECLNAKAAPGNPFFRISVFQEALSNNSGIVIIKNTSLNYSYLHFARSGLSDWKPSTVIALRRLLI
jgi:hypothetical protein